MIFFKMNGSAQFAAASSLTNNVLSNSSNAELVDSAGVMKIRNMFNAGFPLTSSV